MKRYILNLNAFITNHSTPIGRGFWMLLECRGAPAPSRSPQNTVEKNSKSAG